MFTNLTMKVEVTPPKVEEVQQVNKDAWSMGKNLVNLGNLKESMALPDSQIPTFSSSSQPVYIKQQAPTNIQAQPKFVPGMFMTP